MLTLARTRAALERANAAGAQLAVARRGERAELALGQARPDTPMRTDSIVLWMSSTKPLMPVALGQLAERGLLGLNDPVAAHVPEFAAAGKGEITLRHLLTHTAGIPNAHRQWSRETWDEILAKICAAAPEPDRRLGVDCEYHVASAWYVLGEIVRRRDGRSYSDYVREAIFAPLGTSDFWVGMSAEDYAAQRARIARPHEFWAWNGSAEGMAVCRPGGSGWGTARALAAFYAALAGGGAPLLRGETLESLSACALRGVSDRGLGLTLNRGLGFVLDSKEHGPGSAWYGPRSSPRAFGHAGFGCSVAFADPAHDLAVALAWNGFVSEPENRARIAPVLEAVYDDLGL
ncbi:MAG TPA: serine hydrolase domain-containing protein [Myxococcota bacterium]|nr:serine hydrolase domain-containing protein [Myxococcota bacterium]